MTIISKIGCLIAYEYIKRNNQRIVNEICIVSFVILSLCFNLIELRWEMAILDQIILIIIEEVHCLIVWTSLILWVFESIDFK